MKDTIRLILFLDCNMKYSYCCNEQEQFNSQFQKKTFDQIDFSKYKNVCISGGEPFLNKVVLYETINKIENIYYNDKRYNEPNFYLYTNGLLINDDDIAKLYWVMGLKYVNIGIHTVNQLRNVNPELQRYLPVRFMAQDIHCEELLKMYPDRLNKENLKPWILNECNMPNEDWVLLTN